MALAFSSSSDGQGIVEQTRALMRVDSTQWPTSRIVASVNNWLDKVTGYAIGADRTFQWDDTNQTALPIGTTNLVSNQSDYSFLTDQQGNAIITLTRIDILDSTGVYRQLIRVDQSDWEKEYPQVGLDQLQSVAGLPRFYDLIADNIVRLYPKPSTSVTSGLKFYFQRTASYFTASDTTKSPGVSPLLHRGAVIDAAYDGAMTLGLTNLQALGAEQQKEDAKMMRYFSIRDQDTDKTMTMAPINFR